jgi:uncharacterized protein
MRTIIKILFLLLPCWAWCQRTTSSKGPVTKKVVQKSSSAPKPQRLRTRISAISHVSNNCIKLRWAPANAEGWRMGNLFGYVVERYTIMRGGKLLDKVESYRLFGMVPDSLKYWGDMIEKNDNAAIMAQALYGETFSLDLGSKVKIPSAGSSVLGKGEEEKQRYLFSMYAADLDFGVAEKAALGFTDAKVKNGEKYFYRIYPAAPKEYLKSDTALVYVSLDDTTQLPKTSEIIAEPSNKSVILSWDVERTKASYNSFFIERRKQGDLVFEVLNTVPFASLSKTTKDRYGNAVVYSDTGLMENTNYEYRVCGKTIFDEKGPWSDTVKVTCLSLLEGVPGIQGVDVDKSGNNWLNWFFEDSIRSKVQSFEINYSPSGNGEFKKLIGGISPTAKEAILPDSLSAGYLIVKAVSKSGLSRTSFPYLYQPEDSIPPSMPKGLQAIVDSAGVVTLKWLPNIEKDLLGYKVFRSIQKDAEKTVLVDTVWFSNEFHDSLNLNIKNRKAYYTVVALDVRHNQSKESIEVSVIKPDKIPPTSPVFEDFSASGGVIEIKWINSSDEDVKETELQRKAEGDLGWKTIFTGGRDKTSFLDKEIIPGKKYSYKLYAVDSANLRSADAQVLNVVASREINKKGILKLDAQVDREKRLLYVNWELSKAAKIKSIEVFKGDERTPISLYKVLDPSITDMIESELTVNTKYKYAVRVQFVTGEYSDMIAKEINY